MKTMKANSKTIAWALRVQKMTDWERAESVAEKMRLAVEFWEYVRMADDWVSISELAMLTNGNASQESRTRQARRLVYRLVAAGVFEFENQPEAGHTTWVRAIKQPKRKSV